MIYEKGSYQLSDCKEGHHHKVDLNGAIVDEYQITQGIESKDSNQSEPASKLEALPSIVAKT